MGLLRDYLELEFWNERLGFPYDLERVIDDFVLFCMLIGNDFLPGAQCCSERLQSTHICRRMSWTFNEMHRLVAQVVSSSQLHNSTAMQGVSWVVELETSCWP